MEWTATSALSSSAGSFACWQFAAPLSVACGVCTETTSTGVRRHADSVPSDVVGAPVHSRSAQILGVFDA